MCPNGFLYLLPILGPSHYIWNMSVGVMVSTQWAFYSSKETYWHVIRKSSSVNDSVNDGGIQFRFNNGNRVIIYVSRNPCGFCTLMTSQNSPHSTFTATLKYANECLTWTLSGLYPWKVTFHYCFVDIPDMSNYVCVELISMQNLPLIQMRHPPPPARSPRLHHSSELNRVSQQVKNSLLFCASCVKGQLQTLSGPDSAYVVLDSHLNTSSVCFEKGL